MSLPEDKTRISYIEWKDTAADLERLARASGLTVSDLVRAATGKYVSEALEAAAVSFATNRSPKKSAVKNRKKPVKARSRR